MKFDVPVPCFFSGMDFCDALDKTASLGFNAVESYDWKCLDINRVNESCKRNNISLISLCTSEFNMTNPDMRSRWLSCLDESCKTAVKLGVKKLITQVGADTGEDRKIQHESIVTALKESETILDNYGITIMIEPLNVLVDHKGYYLTSSAEAFDIIRESENKYAKVVFDIYHQQVSEGNIIPNVINNLDLIAHLHCAGHPGRHDLQYGENNYNVIFKAIDDAGYTGYCGLEYNPVGDPTESLLNFKKLYT